MMSKIFNWIFGSFFRTLGRIFVYILLGLLLSYLLKDIKIPGLFNILNVNALTIQDGINEVEIKQPATAKFHNITANGMSDLTTTFGQDVPIYESSISLNPSGYGGAVSFEVEGGFLSGYNYAITTYIGFEYDTLDYYITLNNRYSNQNAICNYGFCSSNWNGGYYFSSVKYSRSYTPQLIGIPYGQDFMYSLYATQILYIFTANASAESVLIPFNANISTSTRPIYLLGYNIEVLGQNDLVTNSSLNSAISNSGLATANSVNQVQNSINQVQTDINTGTNNIINNQNSNSQAEIQNANQNTDKTIDSQKVCKDTIIDKNYIVNKNHYLKIDGTIGEAGGWGVTDYINIENAKNIIIYKDYNASTSTSSCFYDSNKILISCINNQNTIGQSITIPNNSSYIRVTILENSNIPQYKIHICKNGNQAIGDNLNDMNSSINNSDSSQATNDASNFFSNFSTNTHGLTGIITAPLNAINSLTSSQCSPLVLPLPFVNQNLTLPCMRTIYVQYFGNFMTLYDIITLGIVSYWVLVRIFGLVKDFKNPEHDEIEVLDL